MDLRELFRPLQATTNVRMSQRATGLNRRTMARYRSWAQAPGLLEHPLPPVEELQPFITTTLDLAPPPQMVASVGPYRALVVPLYQAGVAGTAIWQRWRERGYPGPLSSVSRLLDRLTPRHPQAPGRVERDPGSGAPVDFGYAGLMRDPVTGALRKTWAFVMVLASSRHQDVECVVDHALPTWIPRHGPAFPFVGGVPPRVVLDNLKAGIVTAGFDAPQVQSTYRECAEHDGV